MAEEGPGCEDGDEVKFRKAREVKMVVQSKTRSRLRACEKACNGRCGTGLNRDQ